MLLIMKIIWEGQVEDVDGSTFTVRIIKNGCLLEAVEWNDEDYQPGQWDFLDDERLAREAFADALWELF